MEPKNSLEALDNLVHCKSETRCKECHHKNVCNLERDYNIIKPALEQKEQLEKENQELAEAIQLSNEYFARVERVKADLMIENQKLKKEIQELKQDIQDVIADYQDAAKRMFKYVEAIDEILDYLKSHDVSIDFLSDIENIVARAGYYE